MEGEAVLGGGGQAPGLNGWRIVETIAAAAVIGLGTMMVRSQDEALEAMERNLVAMREVDAALQRQQAILTTLVQVNGSAIAEIKADVREARGSAR